MSDLDADAIQAAAASYHRVKCVPFTPPDHRWSRTHEKQDEALGKAWLAGLADSSWHLVPFGEAP